MILKDNRNKSTGFSFCDLVLGDFFEDSKGVICLKVDDSASKGNTVIISDDGHIYSIATFSADDPVKPLIGTLTISNTNNEEVER